MGSHSYAGPRHARTPGPRHAKPMPPSAVHRSAAAGGLAAALIAGETFTLAGAAGAVTPDSWAKLRACESSGNYAVNTGNGFYGAYQFSLQTWHGMGLPGLPSDAAPAVQDQAAQRLYDARGWQPWPACSAKLGLVDDRAASRGVERLALTPVVATTPAAPATPKAPAPPATPKAPAPPATHRSTHVAATKPAVAGSWSGHYLTTRDVGHARADVTAWQQQMVAAGYHITVDGRYGKQSAAATTQFEAAHGLTVEHPGIVGPQVWSALFK
jgi:resuscitation-promoting factor RpfA